MSDTPKIDIIELAKNAGLTKGYIGLSGISIDASSIERFAALYKKALIDSGELVPAEKLREMAVVCYGEGGIESSIGFMSVPLSEIARSAS